MESQKGPAPGDAAPGPGHAFPTHALEVERQLDSFLPTEVQEQRMSGLIQSLLCAACLGELWMVELLHATELPASPGCLRDRQLDAAAATWQPHQAPKACWM